MKDFVLPFDLVVAVSTPTECQSQRDKTGHGAAKRLLWLLTCSASPYSVGKRGEPVAAVHGATCG